MRHKMEKIQVFLKTKFYQHVKEDSENDTIQSGHNASYGLKHPSASSETSPHSCNGCQAPFIFFDRVKELVDPVHHQLLDECQHKVVLFMGHMVRMYNQRTHIKEALDAISQTKSKKVAWVVLDYKMKMVPVYFREKRWNILVRKV